MTDSSAPVPVPVPQPEVKGSEQEVLLVDDEKSLNQEAHQLLAPFGFVKRNKREMWEAFKANPEGVERCALLAKAKAQREGRSGAGLLLTMIRAGEHLLEPDLTARRITGWRWVRAQHGSSGTFVPDPAGTDTLPPGYDFMTRNPVREGAEEVEHSPEQRAEIAALLRGWVNDRFGMQQELSPDEVTAELEEAESGHCDDCGEDSRLRWVYGKFTVCGACATLRKRAGRVAA